MQLLGGAAASDLASVFANFKFKLLHKQQTTYFYRKPIELELELELELANSFAGSFVLA